MAKGLGAVVGLAGAVVLSMTACATPDDTETPGADTQAVGYVYSGGSWGSLEAASDTDEDDAYVPMSCVPKGAYGESEDEDDAYVPMSCVPKGAYGESEDQDAYEPMTGGLPDYAQPDGEPMTGGLPDYAR
ncbi:hypothetical protein [Demequina subtropica]|uniref:hypothetical protein n=1 Tax=Demequina subtropica TaxID=1638989 RepID=UPI000781B4BA|nr:hypothetical protein [Demequina subtropica]